MKPNKIHTILTVNDLNKSKMFYRLLFELDPIIDEENIVEFELNEFFILGLVKKELPEVLFDTELLIKYKLNQTSTAELYFECSNAQEMHKKALQLGSLELTPFKERDWGHKVGYSVNHDGQVLAFASI